MKLLWTVREGDTEPIRFECLEVDKTTKQRSAVDLSAMNDAEVRLKSQATKVARSWKETSDPTFVEIEAGTGGVVIFSPIPATFLRSDKRYEVAVLVQDGNGDWTDFPGDFDAEIKVLQPLT